MTKTILRTCPPSDIQKVATATLTREDTISNSVLSTELKFHRKVRKGLTHSNADAILKSVVSNRATEYEVLPNLTCFVLACVEGDEVVGNTVVGRIFMKVSAKKALQVPTGVTLRVSPKDLVLPIDSRIEVRAI